MRELKVVGLDVDGIRQWRAYSVCDSTGIPGTKDAKKLPASD